MASINWIHGAEDCDGLAAEGNYPEWQQVQYQPGSFIFHQNKCSNYEAPFVYFFLGKDSGLLIDSGATAAGGQRLFELLREITDLPILLAHTHGHGDHRLGDEAFRNQAGIAVVEIGSKAVQNHFGITRWPDESAAIDLGDRVRDFAYPRA